MKKIVLLCAIGAALSSCGIDAAEAKRVIEAQGITNVQVTGYAWFGCGNDDDYGSNWTGTGANGKPVGGVICGGWLKGYTVRFN